MSTPAPWRAGNTAARCSSRSTEWLAPDQHPRAVDPLLDRRGIAPVDEIAVSGDRHLEPFGDRDLGVAVTGDCDPGDAGREFEQGDVAAPLGWSAERAAWGVLRLATANMAEMVRLATLRRGLDPRDFALVCFGGAGLQTAYVTASAFGTLRSFEWHCPGHPLNFLNA